jgi:hypothetical protein
MTPRLQLKKLLVVAIKELEAKMKQLTVSRQS